MLEVDNGQKLMEDLWEATTSKVELPEQLRATFFGAQGPEPLFHDNKRSYHRYFMRGKAVLRRGETTFGTYTKDISRQGVAFYSPVPLLPKERVRLRLAAAELSLEVARCRRVEPNFYECGARFALQGRSSQ
jgi:hypothetical protein